MSALLAYIALTASLVAATASPGTFEVDLIFPRNDTYAPISPMPLVFAVHNPSLAAPLNAQIDWFIIQLGNETEFDRIPTTIDLRPSNISSASDPYFAYHYIVGLAGIEGSWALDWQLSTGNCSGPGRPGQVSYDIQDNFLIFSTNKTAHALELGAAPVPGTCSAAESFAFNVTAIDDTPVDPEDSPGVHSCAVLGASPTTTSNLCTVTIGPSAASSMSAAISFSACTAAHGGFNDTCTATPVPGRSSAMILRSGLKEWTLVVVVLAFMGFALI